jgi:hypothetical protein
MDKITFNGLSGIISASDWIEFKQEIIYRYGIGKNIHYSSPVEQKNQDWNQQDFDYKFNEYGFRDRPIVDVVDTCYYGCSITTGIGVPEHLRWSNLLDSRCGWTSNNFSISGLGIEDCCYMFAQTTKLVKMDRAVFFLPVMHRTTIPAHTDKNNLQYFRLLPNYCDKLWNKVNGEEIYNASDSFFRLPDTYFLDRARTAINLIRYIAELNNIKVVLYSWDPNVLNLLKYNPDFTIIKKDMAGRDREHPGTDYHSRVADQFNKLL